MLLGRDEHLAAHVAALLGRAELVLPVDAGGAGLDHALHEFVGVERATEAGFGVGDDRQHVVDLGVAVGLAPLDLVGTTQGVVDAGHDRRDGVGGVQRLVGVDLTGEVGVAGDLPARKVDGGETGLRVLDGLATGHGAERMDVVHVVDLLPELLGAVAGHGVLGGDGASKTHHVGSGVVAGHALPARVLSPVFLEGCDLFVEGAGHLMVSLVLVVEFGVITASGVAGYCDREEGDEVVERAPGPQEFGGSLVAAVGPCGFAQVDTKLGEFLGEESVQECVVDDDAVGEADRLVAPLPDLGAAQFGHRRVLEVVVDGDGADADQPLADVVHGGADCRAESALGALAAARVDGEQVAGGDVDVVALDFELVGPVAQDAIELGGRDVDDGGLTDASAVEPIACFAALVDGDLADHRGGSSRVEFVGDDA